MYEISKTGLIFDNEYRSFHHDEIQIILNTLLSRRQRNNGIGKHLMRTLRTQGACAFDIAYRSRGRAHVECSTDAELRKHFQIHLLGNASMYLMERLNDPAQQSLALAQSKLRRQERRRLRKLGLYKAPERGKQAKPRVGDNARLKRHFRKSTIGWLDALSVIAYATRLSNAQVSKRMMESLDERGVATLWVNGGFAFRVELGHTSYAYRGHHGILDILGAVQLYSTNDNTQIVYRRLRSALRKRMHAEQIERQEANVRERAWRKHQQRMAA